MLKRFLAVTTTLIIYLLQFAGMSDFALRSVSVTIFATYLEQRS